MHIPHLLTTTAALTTPTLASPPKYKLTDNFSFTNFFPAFSFFSAPDPTHGFVSYQSLSSASSSSLIGYLPDTHTSYMGVDSTTTTTNPAGGRASVRLESKKSWNGGLLIADIHHMPHSECGVWPAFWLLSATREWPEGGEVDVLEGVDDARRGVVSLHTGGGCSVSDSAGLDEEWMFSGNMTSGNCDVDAEGQVKNKGCSITAPEFYGGGDGHGDGDGEGEKGGKGAKKILPSYGTQFNAQGGGVYAMEWKKDGIKIWFFARSDPSFPDYFPSSNSSTSNTSPDPSTWPTPIAAFSGPDCDFSEKFHDLKIIFDTTFCGEWAGREWESSGCKAKTGVQTCEAYVGGQPEKFEEAYWEVEGVRWYQEVVEGKGGSEKVGREFKAYSVFV